MDSKKIAINVIHSPMRNSLSSEGMRASLGFVSGYEQHEVIVVFIGEGVHCIKKSLQDPLTTRMVAALHGMQSMLLVFEDSIKKRGIAREDLIDEVQVVSPEALLNIYRNCNFVISL